jgi:aryl-alcohol dehydrogenase-like predicted oxidoreductase
MVLLWCLQNRHVSSVILGASRASQLQDNLDALQHSAKMSAELLAQIELLVDNKPKPPAPV